MHNQSTSICKGVLDKSLNNCVSVTILVGMILTIINFKGLILCESALVSSITKIFSSFNILDAGKSFGILIGILTSPFMKMK